MESDQSIDLNDKVPSSRIGTGYQFQREHYQHFALSILVSSIQIALQIILYELRILLEKHEQHSFQGSRECLFVRTDFFPSPLENPVHSPNLDFLLPFDNGSPKLESGSTSRLDLSTLESV